MAGDWIKMRSGLGTDPAVIRIGIATTLDPFAVVGRLHALWAWADAHTANGQVSGLTPEWVNTFTHCPGFAEAMSAVGWLIVRTGGIEFPGFERHMGDGAKSRAQKAKRQGKWRAGAEMPKGRGRGSRVGAGVDSEASTPAPPEKRREEKREDSSPQPPAEPGGEVRPTPAPVAAPKPTRTPEPVPIPAALDTPEFREAWGGWKAERRAKGTRAYTPRGEREQLARLAEWGLPASLVAIRESVANGWQGLFPPKVAGPPRLFDRAAQTESRILAQCEEAMRAP